MYFTTNIHHGQGPDSRDDEKTCAGKGFVNGHKHNEDPFKPLAIETTGLMS
jgi:hypothetical protein